MIVNAYEERSRLHQREKIDDFLSNVKNKKLDVCFLIFQKKSDDSHLYEKFDDSTIIFDFNGVFAKGTKSR